MPFGELSWTSRSETSPSRRFTFELLKVGGKVELLHQVKVAARSLARLIERNNERATILTTDSSSVSRETLRPTLFMKCSREDSVEARLLEIHLDETWCFNGEIVFLRVYLPAKLVPSMFLSSQHKGIGVTIQVNWDLYEFITIEII